jgi:hypothetical protein
LSYILRTYSTIRSDGVYLSSDTHDDKADLTDVKIIFPVVVGEGTLTFRSFEISDNSLYDAYHTQIEPFYLETFGDSENRRYEEFEIVFKIYDYFQIDHPIVWPFGRSLPHTLPKRITLYYSLITKRMVIYDSS